MPYLADRCQDTSSSTGTGSLVLNSVAPTGFQTFFQAFGLNDPCITYAIYDANTSANWETGYGTYDGRTNTLSRDDVSASSNGGAKINFTSGALIILNTLTEDLAKNTKYGVQYAVSRNWAMP